MVPDGHPAELPGHDQGWLPWGWEERYMDAHDPSWIEHHEGPIEEMTCLPIWLRYPQHDQGCPIRCDD
jgi:hypothetical protein